MKRRPRSTSTADAALSGAAMRLMPTRLTTARPAVAAYALAAATTSLGTLLPDDRLHAATKHLVAPLAALGVVARPAAWAPGRRATTATLLVSLTGSAMGDHLMLAESRSEGTAARRHMRRGAAAFAVQQLGFLALMHARGLRAGRRDAALGVAALAALAALDHRASHHDPSTTATSPASVRRDGTTSHSHASERDLPDPVVAAYGALLVAMSVLAQHDERTAAGGRLFLASDAVIVARQLLPHGARRRAADVAVMATYTAALHELVDALAAPRRPTRP